MERVEERREGKGERGEMERVGGRREERVEGGRQEGERERERERKGERENLKNECVSVE